MRHACGLCEGLLVPTLLKLGLGLAVPAHVPAAFADEARSDWGKAGGGLRIHERAEYLEGLPMGPFATLPDGKLITVDESIHALLSTDSGRTWQEHPIFADTATYKIRPERAIICTREGTVVVAFANEAERDFSGWDVNTHDTVGKPVLPTYIVRSTDGAKTWEEPQKLHDDWTGAIRDMIQTKDGTIVFTSMMLRHSPGRHTVVTYASKDEGQTWHRSNVIDLGGIGHHGGVTEATIEQLANGQLLMLARTNWGKLWRSVSKDDGMTWMPIGPSDIDTSAAPAILRRLASGRIFLAWNRFCYEGTDRFPPYGGDGHATGTATSLQRQELSIAFSEDDGQTWSDPVVVARVPRDHDGTWLKSQVSYPYVFECTPGEIWLTTWAGGLRVKLLEKEFVGPLGRPHVVMLGDSTTARRGNLRIYPDQVRKLLHARGHSIHVTNSGVSMQNTESAHPKFDELVLKHEPQAVVIQFGLNDAMVDVWKDPPATEPRVPIDTYEQNLRQFIAEIRSIGARPILMTPSPLTWTTLTRKYYAKPPYAPDDPDGLNLFLHDYADVCRNIAENENVPLVDVFGAFVSQDADALLLDGMHPNEAGHRLIAELLQPVLESTIEIGE